VVLGRIPASATFPGLGRPEVAAAAEALARAGVTAGDVVQVVDAAMAQALRVVSVEQGVDPAGLALVAFGGAGPLHACALADALGMPAVVVPARAGVFSAVGLLAAPRQRDLVRSWPSPCEHAGLAAARRALAAEAAAAFGALDGVLSETWLDCRYQGQGHELTVGSVEAFHDDHARRNGYRLTEAPVEVIAVRARAWVPAPIDPVRLPTTARRAVSGPAVVAEPDCTIWVPEGWHAAVGQAGAYVLRRAR
jgi:N-methylhydantoinase A/oxoprolinase/acetone carboxylase beta subunit